MKPKLYILGPSVFLAVLQCVWTHAVYADCNWTSDGQLHLNVSETPLTCRLPPYANLTITADNLDPKAAFVVFSIQTPNVPLTISLARDRTLDNSVYGSNVGLVSILDVGEGATAKWFLTSGWNRNVTVQMATTVYENGANSFVPIPGACNQEFDLENELNLHLSNVTAESVSVLVKFAPSNVGVRPLPLCDDGDSSPRFHLTYDLYILFLGPGQISKETLFDKVNQMSTVEEILAHGQLIKSYSKEDMTEFYMAIYRDRGSIYNIIVNDPLNGTKAAYVPSVLYSCQLKEHTLKCKDNAIFGLVLMLTFIGLGGLILCLFGHRIFNYEMFFFGGILFFLGFLIALATKSEMSEFALVITATGFGALGGLIHLGLWWRFGRFLWSMLIVGFTLGFLLSAFLFFVTPLQNLEALQSNMVYGLAFLCGILIVPAVFLWFPKVLSIVASALWGSFIVLYTVSYFTTGIFHYMLLDVVTRAADPDYANAYHLYRFESLDYVYFSGWVLLALAGGLLQRHLTRKSPTPFPPCPYEDWKRKRNARMAAAVAYTSTEDEDLSINRDIQNVQNTVDDRSPLITNKMS